MPKSKTLAPDDFYIGQFITFFKHQVTTSQSPKKSKSLLPIDMEKFIDIIESKSDSYNPFAEILQGRVLLVSAIDFPYLVLSTFDDEHNILPSFPVDIRKYNFMELSDAYAKALIGIDKYTETKLKYEKSNK